MSDILDQFKDHKSALAKLAAKIPGLGDFMARNDYRAADKLLRETLAQRIEEQQRRLNEAQQLMLEGSGLLHLDRLERVQTKLTILADSIRSASYGYAGLFAKIKIDEEELARIYEYDHQLFENLQEISSAFDQLEVAIDEGQGMRESISELNRASTAALEALRRRDEVIINR
jgi:hypothetical protein